MPKVIDTVYTPNGKVNIVVSRIKGTKIRRGVLFTSTNGGYWTGRIMECMGFDEQGRIFGIVLESTEPDEEYTGYCEHEEKDPDFACYEYCLCGGDAFHYLQIIEWDD